MRVRKILLATMSLGIGGAETHIVELALELKRRGVEVSVASAGGVYVAELDAAGIPHHIVPMDRRSVTCMLKSLRLLRRLIKRENFDIVHAHARIPGFLCGLLRKIMRFSFITTAHFDFDVGHGLRYLTNWGQKTIAVSEDIKRYLIENYSISSGDISVTINGIDTERFTPELPTGAIAAELGLDLSKPVICNVSRLDERAAAVSRQLIELAPELLQNECLYGAQIVIVGGGEIFDELSRNADAVNAELSRNAVILTGPRTDISEILACCELFVGVSRAALEALAAGKPLIAAGNEGFLGLFTPDKLQIAVDTNFTCRGHGHSSPDLLRDEILRFFDAVSDREKNELREFGRALVVRDYSVSRMTDDCLLAYSTLLGRTKNVLLSGYYGFKNAGDEAILQSIYNGIKSAEGVSVTVLSYDPKDTTERYGCVSVNRFRILRVLNAVGKCDMLVSGGGSLLQDFTSTRSLLYYLFIIHSAKLFGKKVVIYANGIGPVRKRTNRRRVARAVEKADAVSLRDSDSLTELRAMGVKRGDIRVTADPVFMLHGVRGEDAKLLLRNRGVPDGPFVIVSIRDWPSMSGFHEDAAAVCDAIYSDFGRSVLFIAMQSSRDAAVSRHVSALMKNPSFVLDERFTADELMGVIGISDLVLGMRLHALIFAARMRVPFAGIIYDPKVLAYTKLLSMPSAGSVDTFDGDGAVQAVRRIFEQREDFTNILKLKSAELEAAAKADTQFLIDLLFK